MQDTSLVITGIGAVTPIGIGAGPFWQNLVSGVCGVARVTRFDPEGHPVQIAAEVKDFSPDHVIPHNLDRNMALFAEYGYAAAREALLDAGLGTVPDGDRTGVILGTAMDGMAFVAETQSELLSGRVHKVGPRFVPMILGNMPGALLAMAFGLHGPTLTVNTACSSGGDALLTAATLLRAGEADCFVVIGAESIVNPLFMASLSAAKALSRRNDDPGRASRPFDRDRDGFVLGEGGGALVLETAAHAKARGAESYARLAGWASTQDAYHITAPEPEGRGAALCMRLALAKAGLSPSDIGYLNAHGTSTVMGDKVETRAVHLVFGGENEPFVSSTKGATGHMMGAGGITEVICCLKALQTGLLPPTLNLDNPDPDCDLNLVAKRAARADIHAAMSNSLGFGGQNSSIILTRDSADRR